MEDNRLTTMLRGAKQVMDKVEGTPSRVNYGQPTPSRSMNEGDRFDSVLPEMELLTELPAGVTPPSTPPSNTPIKQTFKNLHTSKMAPEILKAMVENPIQVPSMGGLGGAPAFTLEDVKSLVRTEINETEQPLTTPQQISGQTVKPQIMNSQGQMLITMTEDELDKKIQNKLLEFMTTTFTKTLTENTIKKTITTLIKEGKIKVKPKTIKK
jgi:hypothetical protein